MTGPELLASYAAGRRDFREADLAKLRDADLSGEGEIGTSAAASLIYYASDPALQRVPDWGASNKNALADMARLAGVSQ